MKLNVDWSLQPISLPDNIYNKIKDLVSEEQILPGDKLPLDFISQKLSVSSMPLREALNRLVQEGYVKKEPRKGFYLVELTNQEAKELYNFREVIELYTIENVIPNLNKDLIEDLKYNLKNYSSHIHTEVTNIRRKIDKEFHLIIAGACNNKFLVQTLEQIFDKLILKRRIKGLRSRGEHIYKDHKSIIDCISHKKTTQAKQILKKHITEGKENLLRNFVN